MVTASLSELPLEEAWSEEDPAVRFRVAFPFFAGVGTKASAAVYMEIEPGGCIGMHTDSAEEIILILAGEAEAAVGEETGSLPAGGAVVVPELVSHDLKNIGDETLRAIGFFAAAGVVSTFESALQPFGLRSFDTAEIPVAA
jgi:quercetin dioxygenase-like cupin family protein